MIVKCRLPLVAEGGNWKVGASTLSWLNVKESPLIVFGPGYFLFGTLRGVPTIRWFWCHGLSSKGLCRDPRGPARNFTNARSSESRQGKSIKGTL